MARAIATGRAARYVSSAQTAFRHVSCRGMIACRRLGQRPGNVASFLVDTARDFADGRLWTALCLEQATTTVAHFGPIEKCLPVVDQLAGRREDLVRRADVHVTVPVEREVFPTEGPILAFRLVDHRDVRSDVLVFDKPVEVGPGTVGGIAREPL